jgi:hypothetical protein
MKQFVFSLISLISLSVFDAAILRGAPPSTLTLDLADYVALPITGKLDGTGQTDGMLARVTSMREEPGGRRRFFLNDLNGPLYILDKSTKKLTTYLDFNGRDGRPGLFQKLAWEVGFANGLNHFQFDPDYQRNGKFYTVHIEDPALEGGVRLAGYAPTAPIVTPGPIQREGVVIEWTDPNTANATFEGSARELLRIQLNTRIHPVGEMAFNPTARRGDAEWRVMYIGVGDGGSGEAARPDIRDHPQRLDTLVGKILRIVPDLSEHQTTSTVSDNGRYRIPNDNPFVAKAGARKEIWAYGLRNPHRLHFALAPDDPRNNRLIVNSIGLRTWETVNIIHKGANYGYSAREGNEALGLDNKTTKLPEVDKIPFRVGAAASEELIAPIYAAAQYPHKPGGGDAIGSGFLYRGKRFPALRGKYLFTDLSTGRIWYVDYADLLRADDGNPQTMAEMHEVQIRWNNQVHPSMFPIAQAGYRARGGKDPDLPGRATVSGEGRADAQFAVDADGELYVFSKTDGVIRVVTGAH